MFLKNIYNFINAVGKVVVDKGFIDSGQKSSSKHSKQMNMRACMHHHHR